MYTSTGSSYSFQGIWSLLTNWYSKFPDKHPNYDKNNISILMCRQLLLMKITNIGLFREQFADIFFFICKGCKVQNQNYEKHVWVSFWTRMRTGLPNTFLSSVFSLSTFQNQRKATSVRDCLMETYVPACLGFWHISH